jgi:predicted nucleic acid-binding protein
MKEVFVDTHYWIAIANPKDQWHEAAKIARNVLGNVKLVTTDEVLIEFLSGLSSYGTALRAQGAKIVRAILDNPSVSVVPQSRPSFLNALAFYESRKDKQYSLVDCISMVTMTSRSITDVLTHDRHFSQEGFNVLI